MEKPVINAQTVQGGMTIFLALVVTLNVLLNVLIRWSTSDRLGKFLSVILLINIVMVLAHLFMQKKGKGKLQPDQMFQLFWLCLLLATLVFNRGLH